MLGVDLEGGPRGVELLGPAPEGVIEAEVADLAVQHVLAYVALDEVVGRPLDGAANRAELTRGRVRLGPADGAPGQKRRRRGHREAELHEVTGCNVRNRFISTTVYMQCRERQVTGTKQTGLRLHSSIVIYLSKIRNGIVIDN